MTCRLDLSNLWSADARAYDQLSRMTHLQELVLSKPLPADDVQVSHCLTPLYPPHSSLSTLPTTFYPPHSFLPTLPSTFYCPHSSLPTLPSHSSLPALPSPLVLAQPDVQHLQWLDHILLSFLLLIPLMQLAVSGGDNVWCLLDISPLLYGIDHSNMWHQINADNAEMMQLSSSL